jgi:hypothetical protein
MMSEKKRRGVIDLEGKRIVRRRRDWRELLKRKGSGSFDLKNYFYVRHVWLEIKLGQF